MAKVAGSPGSGMERSIRTASRTEQFLTEAAAQGDPSHPLYNIGGFNPSEIEAAYDSNFLQSDPGSFMGVPDILNTFPRVPPVGSRGGAFIDAQTIAAMEYSPEDYEVDTYAKQDAMMRLGLGVNDYATRWYKGGTGKSMGTANMMGQMAGLTDVPTSTTNFKRPRTVAAGWSPNEDDFQLGTVTVVFRDGTPYNFYDVPRSVWIKFHNSISKGRPYLNKTWPLEYKHGPADTSSLPEGVQQMVYTVARTSQIYNRNPSSGKGHYQTTYQVKDPSKVTSKDRVVRYTKDGKAVVKKRVTTYGSPQGPYKSVGNPAENARIAKAQLPARQQTAAVARARKAREALKATNPNKNNGVNPNQK